MLIQGNVYGFVHTKRKRTRNREFFFLILHEISLIIYVNDVHFLTTSLFRFAFVFVHGEQALSLEAGHSHFTRKNLQLVSKNVFRNYNDDIDDTETL